MSRNQSCSLTAFGIVSFLFLFGITSNGTTLVDILLCLCGGALGPLVYGLNGLNLLHNKYIHVTPQI
jgi:hypothetical protein